MLCRDTELVPGGEFTFGVKDGADSMPGYNRHETFILFSSFRSGFIVGLHRLTVNERYNEL